MKIQISDPGTENLKPAGVTVKILKPACFFCIDSPSPLGEACLPARQGDRGRGKTQNPDIT